MGNSSSQPDELGNELSLVVSGDITSHPFYVLFRLLAGSRMASGELAAANVPIEVMKVAVDVAIDLLVRHQKQCKKIGCGYFPPPLAKFRRMRPDVVRSARHEIHKALWTLPDHAFVADVRKHVIANHAEIEDTIRTGRWIHDQNLQVTIDQFGVDAPRILAAVLWATKFGGTQSEPLFRAVVALVGDHAKSSRTAITQTQADQVNQLRTQLRDAKKASKVAQREAEETRNKGKSRDRLLARTQDQLKEATKNLESTKRTVDALAASVDTVTRELEEKQARLDKIAEADRDLHRDFRANLDQLRKLERDRGDLANQLALSRTQLDHDKLRFDSMPTGAEAVWQFIKSEGSRIHDAKLISSGGDKTQADKDWTHHRKLKASFLEAYPDFVQPRPTSVISKSSLRFVALGGAAEVGQSCYLLELGKYRIMIDCGIKAQPPRSAHPDLSRIERLDALIITHAHVDHIGWIPALVRKFPQLRIYCSPGTAALLPIMLDDCYGHFLREKARDRFIAQFGQNYDPIVDDYDEEDLRQVLTLTRSCPCGVRETLHFGNASLTFFEAGHILGASSVLIEMFDGRRVFASGDFASFDQLTVRAASWPESIGEVDLLLLESTYGAKAQHEPAAQSRSDLISFINRVADENGSIILASFGLGRAQELLQLLIRSRISGELSEAIPIDIDGMIKRINPIYEKFASCSFSGRGISDVENTGQRKEILFMADKMPRIIITTSGMLSGGPVLEYASSLLPDSRHRIVLAGYQDEGAPSKALKAIEGRNGPLNVEFEDEEGEKRSFFAARPAYHVSISAHADRNGLVSYSQRVKPRAIALVHGEREAQRQLAAHLKQVHEKADISEGGSELEVA
jgi:Cft2 family RNA processing exonuclease